MVPRDAILTALRALPARMDTPEARVMLVAIGLQESRFEHRRQIVGRPPQPVGPAKGFWQFERGGGCVGVLTHPSSKPHMRVHCFKHGVAAQSSALWDAIQDNDVLAATAARLLLWTDAAPLPALDNAAGAWNYYLRVWRPGKPHKKTWAAFHAQAVAEVAEWPAR